MKFKKNVCIGEGISYRELCGWYGFSITAKYQIGLLEYEDITRTWEKDTKRTESKMS
jgi:hypothetical protein